MKTQSSGEKHQEEKLSAPSGFAYPTKFTLRREKAVEDPFSFSVPESPHDMAILSMPASSNLDGSAIIKRRLKLGHRPWIVYNHFQCEEEAISKQNYMGVIQGCSGCSACQKVSARWDTEDARTLILEEAPVFHPNEEEFKDTLKYIESIRQHVEPYGFCRIVPPPSWQLPVFLEESDVWQKYKFSTRIERINELQNQWSCGKASTTEDTRKAKRRRLTSGSYDGWDANFVSSECRGAQNYKTEAGPQFSLIAFKRYADYFQQHYFSRGAEGSDVKVLDADHKEWEPSEQHIEGEYWHIVEKPTEEIEVLHGIDLDPRCYGCEFAVPPNPELVSGSEEPFTSGWNMNISRLPGSLLSFEKFDSSDILAPQLHVGMCFSSLPWTVEEHQFYKLFYLHLGAPRIWYGTSGCDAYKVDAIINVCLSVSSLQHPDQHHKLGRQVSPATLKSEDIPVYRCIQHPREFVLFLPGVYHSGFDCGFNFSISAPFAPLDWLPHGLNSVELYREQRRKTSISYDKLLLRAANEVVKTQWQCLVMGKKTPKILTWKDASRYDGNGILAKALKTRIEMEARCRKYLSSASQSRKMDKYFDMGDQKRECSTCYYDLYLSAASCRCNPDKYSCLKHANYLCSCTWSDKVFLFRYLISELNMLLDAVEGNLYAIRSWVKEDLGSALWARPDEEQQNSHAVPEASNSKAISSEKDKPPTSNSFSKANSLPRVIPSANPQGKEIAGVIASSDGDSSDETNSLSSLESEIEAYIASLQSCKKSNSSVGNKVSNRRGEDNTRQNVGVNEAVPIGNDAAASNKAEACSLRSSLGEKTNCARAGNPTGFEVDLQNFCDDAA